MVVLAGPSTSHQSYITIAFASHLRRIAVTLATSMRCRCDLKSQIDRKIAKLIDFGPVCFVSVAFASHLRHICVALPFPLRRKCDLKLPIDNNFPVSFGVWLRRGQIAISCCRTADFTPSVPLSALAPCLKRITHYEKEVRFCGHMQ